MTRGGRVRLTRRGRATLAAAAVAAALFIAGLSAGAASGEAPQPTAAPGATATHSTVSAPPTTSVAAAAAPVRTRSPAAATTRSKQAIDPNAPIPATPSSKALNIPASPRDGGSGRRIVYDKALMHVWIVSSANRIVRSYPVTGRWDRPLKGTYRIYSKSTTSLNTFSKATFAHMVRFAYGMRTDAAIGFHAIPVFYETTARGRKGQRMSSISDLGLPVATGGCVRQADADAQFLYDWSRIGDRVVVLPSP